MIVVILLCNRGIFIQYIRCPFLSLQRAITFYTGNNMSWVDLDYSMQKCCDLLEVAWISHEPWKSRKDNYNLVAHAQQCSCAVSKKKKNFKHEFVYKNKEYFCVYRPVVIPFVIATCSFYCSNVHYTKTRHFSQHYQWLATELKLN